MAKWNDAHYSRPFKSKYDGWCWKCSGKFMVGDMICFNKRIEKYQHEHCEIRYYEGHYEGANK